MQTSSNETNSSSAVKQLYNENSAIIQLKSIQCWFSLIQ